MSKRFLARPLIVLLAFFAVIGSIPGSAFAAPVAPRILLVLDGVSGESKLKGYEKAIDITGFSFGVSSAASSPNVSGGMAVGKPAYSEFSFTKYQDSATLQLLAKMAVGTSMKSGTIYFIKDDGGKPYLTIKLQNIFVTSDQLSAEESDRIAESVSLRAVQMTFLYEGTGADGKPLPAQTLDIDVAKGTAKLTN